VTTVTLDSESRQACLWVPDGRGMTLRASVETDKERGLTGRETRRALSSTLRLGLEYTVTISTALYAAQRETSHTSSGELPVQVPLWPAGFGAGESATLETKHWVTGTQGEAGALSSGTWATSTPTPTGSQVSVPTMRGYLTQPVDWDLLDPRWVRGQVRFDEAGPADEAVTIPSETWTPGPTVAGVTTYVFPLELLDFKATDPGANSVTVEFSQRIGFGRDVARHVYPQLAVRNPQHTLTLNGPTALSKLLRWFSDHTGSVKPFWIPVWTEEMRLASNTSSGSANVTLNNATALGSYRRVAFLLTDGSIITRNVLSIAGNVLTLDSSPGTLAAASTAIITLALVRFAADTITIRADKLPVMTTTVGLVEIREEVSTPSGETAGTTIGVLDPVVYLYEFTAGAESWTFTSHDADLGTSPTWTAKQIEHGDITQSTAIDKTSVSLKTGIWTDNPLLRSVAGTLWERMTLTIYEADPTDIAGKEAIFTGHVRGVKRRSGSLQATIDGAAAVFDRVIPRTLMQTRDNWALGEDGNGLDVADWTFTGTATSQADEVVTLDTLAWPGGALPTLAANYFALGYAVRPAPNYARIPIISSTAESGGSLTVTLAYAPSPAVTTSEVLWQLIPGYDGTIETAEDKFANGDNFGGFPFVPIAAPNLIAVKRNSGNAGKK